VGAAITATGATFAGGGGGGGGGGTAPIRPNVNSSIAAVTGTAVALPETYRLTPGTPELCSAGVVSFAVISQVAG
jgi:hypothetical protein